MFAVSRYDQIEQLEKEKKHNHLIMVLLVRPGKDITTEIITDFDYLHYRSGESLAIYAAGYTNDFDHAYEVNYREVTTCNGSTWYYSAKDFDDFRNNLAKRVKSWKYSGDIELLVFQGSVVEDNGFDFRNYISLNISYGLKHNFISSFSSFMELVIDYTERALNERTDMLTPNGKLKVRPIIESAIENCNDTSISVKKIVKNRHFYKLPSSTSTITPKNR